MDSSYDGSLSGSPVVSGGTNTGGVFGGSNDGQMSQGEGDIILQPDGNKSKKGLIIGLVIGFVVVIVVVLVLLLTGVFTGGNTVDQEGKTVIAKDYQEAFNIYANYYLFGELGNKNAVDWGATEQPTFESAYDESFEYVGGGEEDDEEEDDMTAQLVLYFETFREFYDDLPNKTDYLTGLIKNNSDALAFLSVYYSNGITTRTEMIEKYVSGGEGEATKMINGKANAYEDVSLNMDENIKGLVYELGNDQLGIIKLYDENGCLAGGDVDYGCAARIENDAKRQLFDRISIIEDRISNIVEKAGKRLRVNVFEINYSFEALNSIKEDD